MLWRLQVYGMRATYFFSEHTAGGGIERGILGKRSTKTKLKNINKCVVFESILQTFCNRSFKTKEQLFSTERTIARRAINTCDTTSSCYCLCSCLFSFSRRNNFVVFFTFRKSECKFKRMHFYGFHFTTSLYDL